MPVNATLSKGWEKCKEKKNNTSISIDNITGLQIHVVWRECVVIPCILCPRQVSSVIVNHFLPGKSTLP